MIALAGVSHRAAPLAVREALAFPREGIHEALARLRAEAGLAECVILSTCNRVEVLGVGADATTPDELLRFLAEFHRRSASEIEPHAYRLAGDDAVRHAFRVAASLDSMVVGEAQILGQVKEAYQAAEQAGTLGPVLTALRNRLLSAAKRVRTETGVGQNAVSVSHVAVELARKIFGDLAGRQTLLVGAGKMSELAARRLVAGGARTTVLGGRTLARAEALAAALGARCAPLEALREELGRADIVVSGTGAPGIVIRREDVAAARAGRNRPLFLIDIAVPRDIDPGVRNLSGVFLYDLDDLKTVAEANLRERGRQAEAAEAIVALEVAEFLDWRRSLDVVPVLVALRRRGEEVRRAEIEKALRHMGPLTTAQVQAVEAAAAGIVNKLLHPATVQLKELARGGNAAQVSLLCDLLGLPHPASAEGTANGDAPRSQPHVRRPLVLDPSHP